MKGWILVRGVSIDASKIAGHWEIDNLIVILDAKDVILDDDLSK
jgi:transketolase